MVKEGREENGKGTKEMEGTGRENKGIKQTKRNEKIKKERKERRNEGRKEGKEG